VLVVESGVVVLVVVVVASEGLGLEGRAGGEE